MKVLVDATNLIAGGAVQVAASLIDELQGLASEKHPWFSANTVEIRTSEPVMINLQRGGPLPVSSHGRRWRTWQSFRGRRSRYDVAWSIFGPVYGRRISAFELMGYADVTSVYAPVPSQGHGRPAIAALQTFLSRRSVRKADHVVVETFEMKRRTCCVAKIPTSKVSVIPNAPHEVFTQERQDQARLGDDRVTMLYVARAYPHKNHSFLGQLGQEINRLSPSPEFRFVVTLSESEWDALSEETKKFCDNVGPVIVKDLPELYARVNAVIFPSLLEAFSATPLEALATKRPLFASDRGFVRSVVGEAAVYFDPTDARQAARVIREAWNDQQRLRGMIELGTSRLHEWPTGRDRAVSYLDLMADLG